MSAISRVRRGSQSGHAMITVTISIVTLLAFAGLAIDVGYLESVKRNMQTAADSAAIAGAQELLRQLNGTAATDACTTTPGGTANSVIKAAACHDASTNGYSDGLTSTSITINNPPGTGYYAGDNNAVEAVITQSNQPMSFMQILGVAPATVAARAVAHLGSGSGCLIALDSSSRGAITFNGNGGSINLGDCNVIDNSDNCSGMVDNSATVVASSFSVVGSCPGWSGSGYSTTPSSGVLPTSDPLANLPPPPIGTCQTFNPANTTISPGTYCGGNQPAIKITGGTYTFQPGIYVIDGGGMSIGGGATISGTGVMFYLTGTLTGTNAYGPVSIDGTTQVSLSAPSSGTYQDVLFYQDRSLKLTNPPYLSTDASSFGGTSTSVYNGIFYFPTSAVTFSGTPGMVASNAQIIAWDLTISGSVNFNANYAAMPGGGRPSTVVLGE